MNFIKKIKLSIAIGLFFSVILAFAEDSKKEKEEILIIESSDVLSIPSGDNEFVQQKLSPEERDKIYSEALSEMAQHSHGTPEWEAANKKAMLILHRSLQYKLNPDLNIETTNEAPDPKFGLENELRDPVTTGGFFINPISIGLLHFTLLSMGASVPLLDILNEGKWLTLFSIPIFVILPSKYHEVLTRVRLKFQKRGREVKDYEIKNGTQVTDFMETNFYTVTRPDFDGHSLAEVKSKKKDGDWEPEIDGVYEEPDLVRDLNCYTCPGNRSFWLYPATSNPFVSQVNSSPSTVSGYEANRSLMDRVMFQPSKNFGLRPASFLASGHIHMDQRSAFRGNPQLLRDFIVDILNHSGFISGPLTTHDRLTALSPLRDLQAIRQVIEDFDRGEYQSVEELGNALWVAGFRRRDIPWVENSINRFFYFLEEVLSKINLRSLPSISADRAILVHYDTIEFRFLRSQKSSEEIINFLKLFKARLRFLEENPGVELDPNLSRRVQSPLEKYRHIKDYVVEAGLDWEPYRQMLPRWWRVMTESLLNSSVCQRIFSRTVKSEALQ